MGAERIEPICPPTQGLKGNLRMPLDHRPGIPATEPLQCVRRGSCMAVPGGEGVKSNFKSILATRDGAGDAMKKSRIAEEQRAYSLPVPVDIAVSGERMCRMNGTCRIRTPALPAGTSGSSSMLSDRGSSFMRASLALLFVPLTAVAQSPMPTEFPADAVAIAGDALQSRVAGKALTFKAADGVTLRIEYKSNGYAFINTSRGFSDSGTWRAEGNTLCIDWKTATGGCSEARVKGKLLYIKRTSNGEVVVAGDE